MTPDLQDTAASSEAEEIPLLEHASSQLEGAVWRKSPPSLLERTSRQLSRPSIAVAALTLILVAFALILFDLARLAKHFLHESASKASPSIIANDKPVWLLATMSYAAAQSRRNIIRTTWQELYPPDPSRYELDLRYRFVLANPGENSPLIAQENKTYGDIIVLDDLEENREIANTIKTWVIDFERWVWLDTATESNSSNSFEIQPIPCPALCLKWTTTRLSMCPAFIPSAWRLIFIRLLKTWSSRALWAGAAFSIQEGNSTRSARPSLSSWRIFMTEIPSATWQRTC
jgi:hypothetical protein